MNTLPPMCLSRLALVEVRSSSSNEVASGRSRDRAVTSPCDDDVTETQPANNFDRGQCSMDVADPAASDPPPPPERECAQSLEICGKFL